MIPNKASKNIPFNLFLETGPENTAIIGKLFNKTKVAGKMCEWELGGNSLSRKYDGQPSQHRRSQEIIQTIYWCFSIYCHKLLTTVCRVEQVNEYLYIQRNIPLKNCIN